MEKKDFTVEVFDLDRANVRFPIICVYDKPDDYPDKYVARLWDIDIPTRIIMLADDITALRERKPQETETIPRDEKDDEVIVETWV